MAIPARLLSPTASPGAPRQVHFPVPAALQPQASMVTCVRKGRKTHKRCGECNVYGYQLVRTYRTQGRIERQVLANLGELEDLGEFSVPEIALEEAIRRLQAEKDLQCFQEKEFACGWHRSGPGFNCTRYYTQQHVRQERIRMARHVERLQKQVSRLERVVARYPTPPDVLERFRERYTEVRAEAARRFAQWEADLIDQLAGGE